VTAIVKPRYFGFPLSLRDIPHGAGESSTVPLKIRAIKKAASVSEGRPAVERISPAVAGARPLAYFVQTITFEAVVLAI
jgi:hypothetical protein